MTETNKEKHTICTDCLIAWRDSLIKEFYDHKLMEHFTIDKGDYDLGKLKGAREMGHFFLGAIATFFEAHDIDQDCECECDDEIDE